MAMDNERARMQILEMIESGQLSTEEGLRMLETMQIPGDDPALEDGPPPEEPEAPPVILQANESENANPEPEPGVNFEGSKADSTAYSWPTPPGLERWRRFWMIPLWAGVAITVIGGLLMYQALEAAGIGFWFVCASVPFLIGLVILILAWQSRTALWLHLRVKQKPGARPESIAISFPVLLRPTAWALRKFGHHIPHLGQTSVDEILLALEKTANPDNPLYIEVDEGEDGERVEIYIG